MISRKTAVCQVIYKYPTKKLKSRRNFKRKSPFNNIYIKRNIYKYNFNMIERRFDKILEYDYNIYMNK